MAMISTISSTTGRKTKPNTDVRMRNVARAMNDPTMKISPWAKLIMPMMP